MARQSALHKAYARPNKVDTKKSGVPMASYKIREVNGVVPTAEGLQKHGRSFAVGDRVKIARKKQQAANVRKDWSVHFTDHGVVRWVEPDGRFVEVDVPAASGTYSETFWPEEVEKQNERGKS